MASREKPGEAQAVEKRNDEKPAAAEFGRMVSDLASVLGVTGTALRDIIKQDQTRRQNADALREWLRQRPRAK